MSYSARDIALCMEKVVWRGTSFAQSGFQFYSYWHSSNKACKRVAARLGISWEEVMNEYPITKWEEPPQELWEEVVHPALLVNDVMDS